MWIQMVTVKNIEIAGRVRTYHPGDWVDIGKHDANLMIGRGEAILPKGDNTVVQKMISDQSGVLVFDNEAVARDKLSIYKGIQVDKIEQPTLMHERNFLWDTSAPIHPPLVAVGFHLLNKWEICVPLADYKILACNIGTEEERQATKDVIRDLRVPLYDTRVMFVKMTPDTSRLIKIWSETEGDRQLAFLQALYRVKPFILALPASWAGVNVPV